MAQIVPAILETNFPAIREKINLLEGVVDWVQLDVVDGLFAPHYSWENWRDLKSLDGRIKLGVHLMIEQPEQYLEDWLGVADLVVVHYEATEKLSKIVESFESRFNKFGLALLLETPLQAVEPYADKVHLIQLMGIEEIGAQGQEFSPSVIERVADLRAKYPKLQIAVDGGVGSESIGKLLAAGANDLVIGSAIWQSPDPLATVKELKKLIEH